MVEVLNSLDADGAADRLRHPHGRLGLRSGGDRLSAHCFEEYKVNTDDSGRYFAAYKRWHLIGLEVGMSVANVGLRGEATGTARAFRADVVAIAKRDLAAGEVLDGEGGYCVAGQLRPSAVSVGHAGAAAGPDRKRHAAASGQGGHDPDL